MSRVQLASIIFATAVAVMIAPFLHPAVSLSQYLTNLEIAAEHGLRLDLFIQNIIFLALIMTPGIAIYFLKRPMLLHEFPLSIPVLITSGIIVAAVGAKNGAGVHHMLPLVPAVTMATLQIAQLKSQDPSALISREAGALSCRILRGLHAFCGRPVAFDGSCDSSLVLRMAQNCGTGKAIWSTYLGRNGND